MGALGNPRGIEDLYPLAPAQEGMLFHSLLTPDSGVYVDQLSTLLRGDLDDLRVAALEEACRRLLERHAILRTGFLWRDLARPLQVVHARVEPEIVHEDWRGLPEAEQERRLADLLAADRRRGFMLERAPLVRWRFVQTAEHDRWLVWTHHHLLLDGWSFSALGAELLATYAALSAGVEPVWSPRPPYRDYIAWLERQDPAAAEEYWRRTLAGWSEPTPLVFRREREDTGETGGGSAQTALAPAATAALQEQARRHRLTLNTLVQAAWGLLLARTSGEDDAVFGITVSGRPPEVPGIERMIGLFINTLPLRLTAAPALRLGPWLEELQRGQAELRQHEHTPLVRVQGWSGVPRGRDLFDSILVFESYPREAAMQGGQGGGAAEGQRLGVADSIASEQTNYPLTVLAIPGEVVLPLHPRTRARLEAAGLLDRLAAGVELLAPQGYLDFTSLLVQYQQEEITQVAQLVEHRREVRNMNEPTKPGTPPSVEGIVTRPSPFSVEETLQRLQEAIHSRNLTLFAHIDHSGEAKRVGLKMQEAHVLIFGSPKAGTPLMIASPLLALDLPLKVLVWQGEDDRVWVSSTSAAYLRVRYSIPQELIGNIAGVDALIEQTLQG